VVLIDEIDKAPKDVPNDLLWELEEMSFNISEVAAPSEALIAGPDTGEQPQKVTSGSTFSIRRESSALRPIVIITSNSEKSLPDAFLRRCVYYHVPFPDFDDSGAHDHVSVQTIVASRLQARYQGGGEKLVEDAISFFRFLREQSLERKPGLAELLNWLDYLLPPQNLGAASLGRLMDMDEPRRSNSIGITLLKQKDDQKKVQDLLNGWQQSLQPGVKKQAQS